MPCCLSVHDFLATILTPRLPACCGSHAFCGIVPKTVFLQVARCTKIINPGTDEAKYVINVKQIAKVRDSI